MTCKGQDNVDVEEELPARVKEPMSTLVLTLCATLEDELRTSLWSGSSTRAMQMMDMSELSVVGGR